MQSKEVLIDSLYEKQLLNDNEEIILSDGFETALIGVSTSEPKIAIYDFWKALDCVIKAEPNLDFNEALEWLEEFSQLKIINSESLTPIFVKTL
jgi:hypothetical protein|tara:strand:- start:10750 stop:11031 length:282 start_codon:yes stop_codon:yes gene_type:complete